jgi:prophage maintenance system killer protein
MIKFADKNSLAVYQSKDGGLVIKAKVVKDSIWLNQSQIADLFSIDRSVITKHLSNIFKTQELKEVSNVQKMHVAGADRPVKFYSLDVIISVGYRVNSKKATQFRIWATKIIKEHLLKGYSVNRHLLLTHRNKFKELQTTIDYLENQAKDELLRGQGQELLSLVKDYTKSLKLLEEYDNKKIKTKKGAKTLSVLTTEWAETVIGGIKESLSDTGRQLGMFGVDTNKKLDSIVRNIGQTFSGNDLYPTLEDKTANLLYLVIKDHPFLDGNKRIASLLFVTYLDQNKYLYRPNGERKINDNALVALAILVAVSNPMEKDLIIDLIKSLLT